MKNLSITLSSDDLARVIRALDASEVSLRGTGWTEFINEANEVAAVRRALAETLVAGR